MIFKLCQYKKVDGMMKFHKIKRLKGFVAVMAIQIGNLTFVNNQDFDRSLATAFPLYQSLPIQLVLVVTVVLA